MNKLKHYHFFIFITSCFALSFSPQGYEWLVEPKFSSASEFQGGYAIISKNFGSMGSKYGIINKYSTQTMLYSFDRIKGLSEGHCIVVKDGKHALTKVSTLTKETKPTKWFDFMSRLSEGLAMASLNGKRGYVNAKSEWVIQPQAYRYAMPFSEGLALVSKKGAEWGYIDKTGKLVIDFKKRPSMPSDFSDGMARFNQGGKWGYMNKSGKEVIPPKYDKAGDFSSGVTIVQEGDLQMGIDKTGKVVFRLEELSEQKDRYTGAQIIKKINAPSLKFSEGVLVGGNTTQYQWGRWGVLNTSGKWIWVQNGKFKTIRNFKQGFAPAKPIGSRWGLIDKEGKWVLSPSFQEVGNYGDGLVPVSQRGRWGYVKIK